jgi:hypothetical protein
MDREAEFLRAQIATAKLRLRQHGSALSQELTAPLELRPLVRRRPLVSLLAAGFGGLFAGVGLRGVLRGRGAAAGRGRRFLAFLGGRLRGLAGSMLATVIAANLGREPTAPRTPASPPPPHPSPVPTPSSSSPSF